MTFFSIPQDSWALRRARNDQLAILTQWGLPIESLPTDCSAALSTKVDTYIKTLPDYLETGTSPALASRNEQRHPTKSKGNGRILLGECAGISARRLIVYSATMQGTNPPCRQGTPSSTKALPGVIPHSLRCVVLTRILLMGIPPDPAEAEPEFQHPTVGSCLGSALRHPLLHWTVDQLPPPRTRERCSEEQPLHAPREFSAGFSQSQAEEQLFYGHSCSTHSTVSTPLGVNPKANPFRGFVLPRTREK